jgi:hypothetical protein
LFCFGVAQESVVVEDTEIQRISKRKG